MKAAFQLLRGGFHSGRRINSLRLELTVWLHMMVLRPSIYVGVSDLKAEIQNARLVQFQWNIGDLCDNMTGSYLSIDELNGHHDDMVLSLFCSSFR